jgi:hypothetical protein
VADRFAGLQEALREQVGIKEVFIGLTGPFAEAVELGEFLDGDGVGDLEPEKEVVWSLADHALQVLPAREGVIGGVHTHSLEDLGVLRQAFPVEAGFGKLAAVFVADGVVNGPAPAGVFPGGSADEHTLPGERCGLFGQLFAGQGHCCA